MADDELAHAWRDAGPRLVGVAYGILGDVAAAEDVVADCWPRLVRSHAVDPVRDVLAWGVTAVGRAAVDVLRSARVRRESYVGPWLPEPVVAAPGPEDRAVLDDTVRYALLVALEALTPAERTAWLLHDVFGVPFDEVAEAVGRRPDAVRQLARRARTHLAAGAPRTTVEPEEHHRVVEAFGRAARGGDLAALLATLDPDVVVTTDGGGVAHAARRPVRGADNAGRFLLGVLRRNPLETRAVAVNGGPGLAMVADGELRAVVAISVVAGRVARLDIVMAPPKLGRAAAALGLRTG